MSLHQNASLPQLFQALADPTRLRLINLMAGQEVCVCYFVELLDLSQPKISRHLAYLRRAGLVTTRRDGKWMHYALVTPPHAGTAAILRETIASLKAEKTMQADRARLAKACCAPAKFALEGAPVPSCCGARA